VLERGAAGRVHLLDHVDKAEAVLGAGGPDTFSLLGGADEAFALAVTDPRNADDANGAGGSRGSGR
jgi:hypothetical protein